MSFTYHFKAHIYRGIKRLHTVYIDMMIRPCPGEVSNCVIITRK